MKRVSMTMLLAVAMTAAAVAQQAPANDAAASSGAAQPAAPATAQFTQRDADDVLRLLRDGLAGHSQRTFLKAFDGSQMEGYLSFKDQVEEFFQRYDLIRVNIKIVESSADGDKGEATASFQMEVTPRNGNNVRSEGQLRFVFAKGKAGWRIVDVNPRSFFQ